MAEQEITLRKDMASCGCPKEVVLELSDSTLTTATLGRYIRAKIISYTSLGIGGVATISFDEAQLANPATPIATCEIVDICCMDPCDLYLESIA